MYHQRYFNLVILNKDNLDDFFVKFKKAKYIWWDGECSGLRVHWEGADYLVGLTFSFEDEVSKDVYYAPLRHHFEGVYDGTDRFRFRNEEKDKVNFPDFDKSKFEGEYYNLDCIDFIERLKAIWEGKHCTMIGHHTTFDLHLLANEGFDIEKIFTNNKFEDTQVMVHVIDEEQEKNLEAVTEALFGVKKSHYSDTIGTVTPNEKRSVGLSPTANASFQHVQIPIGAQYSAEDVWFMKQMTPSLEQAVKDEGSWDYYRNVRMEYMKTIFRMERNGVKIDIPKLDRMTYRAKLELDRLTYKMYELAGITFNINSGQQLYEILYGWKKRMKDKKNGGYKTTFNEHIIAHHFGFKPVAWTDGGKDLDPNLKAPKTDKEAIKKLLMQKGVSDQAIQFLKTYQDYSKLNKLYTTFMVGLKENLYCDGKVHPSFNMCGCLVADTLIPTDKGIFKIKDLVTDAVRDGESVPKKYTLVNRNMEFEDTSHIVRYVNRDTVKVTTSLGCEIEGTRNHPIICNKYKVQQYYNNSMNKNLQERFHSEEYKVFRRLDSIDTNTYVAIPYDYHVFSKEYIPLNYKDLSLRPQAKEIRYPQVLDEDVALFMGMYYADGSIKTANGSCGIEISNGDEDVVAKFTELSKKLFGLDTSVYRKSNSATTIISAKRLLSVVDALKLKRGCVNKVIPDIILQSPESVVKAFIRGMTLDSYVINKPPYKLRFTVSNKDSAKTLQCLLFNLGIVSGVSHPTDERSKNVYIVNITNNEYIKFRDTIGFVQSKKYVDIPRNSKLTSYMFGKGVIWVKVKSIEYGKADVYDFTLPKTHSFVSQCFISHNTDSHRNSANMPNLLQMPHPLEKHGDKDEYYDYWSQFEIRELMIAEDSDRCLIATDYKSLEKFITAHFSQDKLLGKILTENLDSHGVVSTLIFPELEGTDPNLVKKVAPDLRQVAKKVGFALDYGGGAGTIARNLEIDLPTAQKYIDKYFDGFSGLKKYDHDVVKFGKKNGYVEMLYKGHKRHLWHINSSDTKRSSYYERVAVNVMSQGSGADIAQVSQIDIDNDVLLKSLGVKQLVQVYDEILVSCPKKYALVVMERIKYFMENSIENRGFHLTYPLIAVGDMGDTYAESK